MMERRGKKEMKKELLSCINNRILQQRKQDKIDSDKRRAIEDNKRLLNKFERDGYMKKIHEFFRGFYPDRGFTFPLYQYREMTSEEYTDQYHLLREKDKEYDYPRDVVRVKDTLPPFKGIGFDELEFGYDHQRGEFYMKGMLAENPTHRHHEYFMYNHRSIDYESWSNKSLKVFVEALPWIEDYIAKEYGCKSS
jgi:hypothetical protein